MSSNESRFALIIRWSGRTDTVDGATPAGGGGLPEDDSLHRDLNTVRTSKYSAVGDGARGELGSR